MVHGVLMGVLVASGVLACVAVILAPLWFSWPRHVRWVVTAQWASALGGPFEPLLDLREVELTAVMWVGHHLELTMLEKGHPASHTATFEATARIPPATVNMLQEWALLRTPMLLYVDPSGNATLSGPVAALPNLRRRGADQPMRAA